MPYKSSSKKQSKMNLKALSRIKFNPLRKRPQKKKLVLTMRAVMTLEFLLFKSMNYLKRKRVHQKKKKKRRKKTRKKKMMMKKLRSQKRKRVVPLISPLKLILLNKKKRKIPPIN